MCFMEKICILFFKYLFICLASPGLVCGMQSLSCGTWDLVPWSGTELRPPALRVWSLSHCTTREVLKIGVLDKVCSGMNYSAVGYDLMLTNKQYILHKVTLNRNTCKTRLYIKNQLTETLWSEACRNLTLYFLEERLLADSVLMVTL